MIKRPSEEPNVIKRPSEEPNAIKRPSEEPNVIKRPSEGQMRQTTIRGPNVTNDHPRAKCDKRTIRGPNVTNDHPRASERIVGGFQEWRTELSSALCRTRRLTPAEKNAKRRGGGVERRFRFV